MTGRDRRWSSRLQWASRLLALLVVALFLGAFSARAADTASPSPETGGGSASSTDDSSPGQTSSPGGSSTLVGRTGTVTIGKGERRATVTLEVDLTDSSKVTATAAAPESGEGATVKKVVTDPDDDAFTIVLNRQAPSRTVVTWTAVDLDAAASPDETDSDFWSVEWLVIVLVTAAFLAVIAWALWRTLQRPAHDRGPPDTDRGLLFVSFLKVVALLVIASLAIVAVAMTDVEDSANLAALFGLFGTIAGYLAGNTPTVETEDPPPAVDGAAAQQQPQPPPPGTSQPQRGRRVTQSLL